VRNKGCAIVFVLLLTGCSLGDRQVESSEPRLASGRQIPTRCVPGKAQPAATVTFVANGGAWALDPDRGRLSCLFSVGDPGPFAWGPRGDRALLARLEVKALADAPRRGPTRVDPVASSWGRPTGRSIVFVARDGRTLLKAHPAGGGFTDVTPVRRARYKLVAYHPSGLAFAFVLRRDGRESVWISSNVGKSPRRLVHGRLHTGFDALAFGKAGTVLYFAARHSDGHVDVHSLELVGATSAPAIWRGALSERVSDLFPGPRASLPSGELAFTVGRSCESRRAVVMTARHPRGAEALPGDRPSRVVGWLDSEHVLVAAGGCGQKLDLFSVSTRTLAARPLVRTVDAASVRVAEPSPPPPLPAEVLRQSSGFA
jgi:hypothetical protein